MISHANEQPLKVMKKAGFVAALGEDAFLANIDEALDLAEKIVFDARNDATNA